MQNPESIPLEPRYQAKKEDLITLVSKCQQRSFSEEVDYLEELGGDTIFEDLLSVDFHRGVRNSEVIERRNYYGSAEAHEEKIKGFFQLMWIALKDFTLRILLVSAAVSIIANVAVEDEHRELAWIEGFAIFVAVMVCSSVAAANDYQKEKQFRKLKEFAGSKKEVNVWRDGSLVGIHESQLVAGDIVKISEGMDIPADMLLIQAYDMTTNESALTGEPDAIKKKVYKDCIDKRDEIIAYGEKHRAKAHDVYSPILISGTSVLTGEGKAIVLVVGESSILGQIRKYLVQEIETTPLQHKIEKVTRGMGKFGLVVGILIFFVLLIRFLIDRAITDTFGDGEQYVQLVQFMIISITVIVVAIPEGLPLAVTLSLTYSVKKMMNDKNLVRRLHAAETMGGANNICSDKTGTLTQNKMNLTNFWNEKLIEISPYTKANFSEYFPAEYHDVMRQALACNSSATLTPYVGSKTEIALLEFLQNNGEDYEILRQRYLTPESIKFPFSSQRKRMSSILGNVENGTVEKRRMHIKGASEIVLEACDQFFSFESGKAVPMTPELKKNIEDEIEKMAIQALRTICIGYKEINDEDFTAKDDKNVYDIEKSGFILLGVLGIRDILRQEVKDAVAKCKRAGVKVRMVTGDNKITATAIAKECGIIPENDENSLVMTGPEFIELTGGVVCKKCRTKDCNCPRDKEEAKKMKKEIRVDTIANAEVFDKICDNLDVLARSRPEDKYALVTGLIERGNVVAVTGDGTNDAPALKKADVGFAMNSGTDVAKDASDIVLLDDNFASIVKAAMWGRNIYDNIRKFFQFQLTVNFVAVTTTIIGAAVLRQTILTAVQLLWVNLIMDVFISLALTTEKPTDRLLERRPYDRNEFIVSRPMMKHIFGQALYQVIIIVVLVFTGDKWVPESLGPEPMPVEGYEGYDKYRSDDGVHIRSGRNYFITSVGKDYDRFFSEIGPSRHFTLVFNTFMFCQVFNFLNCRKIHQELNIFSGITKNPTYIVIFILNAGLQLVIGNFGGIPFGISSQGMDIYQWLIAIGLASFTLVWSFILKFIPAERFFPEIRKRKSESHIHTENPIHVNVE